MKITVAKNGENLAVSNFAKSRGMYNYIQAVYRISTAKKARNETTGYYPDTSDSRFLSSANTGCMNMVLKNSQFFVRL